LTFADPTEKAASSLGVVRMQDIDNALKQRLLSAPRISTIYTQRNQYMVVLEDRS